MRRNLLVAFCLVFFACGDDAATETTAGTTVATTLATTTTTPVAAIEVIPTATGPIILAATEDSIWVEAHRANITTRIDPEQNLEVFRTTVPTHCTVAAGAGFVWATVHLQGRLTKIDPATGLAVETTTILGACGLAVDDSDVFVTSPDLGRLFRYDPVTLEERAEVPIDQPFFMVVTADSVWVYSEADGGVVVRVDRATDEVIATVPDIGVIGVGMVFGFDTVWVAVRDSGTVYRIDPSTNQVIGSVDVGTQIGGIGLGDDEVWASGFGNGRIYRIDASGEITGTLNTGHGNLGPPLFAFGSLWVAALDSNAVLRINPDAVTEAP